MTEAGADIIVAHMGLTTSGTIGAHTAKSLDHSVVEVQAIIDTCKELREDVWSCVMADPSQRPTMRLICFSVAIILTVSTVQFHGTLAHGNRDYQRDSQVHLTEAVSRLSLSPSHHYV